MTPPSHPKWLGVLVAFLLPGYTQYLAGEKKIGVLLFAGLLATAAAGRTLVAVPARPMILLGWLLVALAAPTLFLFILYRSYRPIPRRSPKAWFACLAVLIGVTMGKSILSSLLPTEPYAAPTASMEPTIRGARAIEGDKDASFMSWLARGKHARGYVAQATGAVDSPRLRNNRFDFTINGEPHALPSSISRSFKPQARYTEGEVIWSGTITSGDMVMVDKLAYLFSSPRRGDIVAFDPSALEIPGFDGAGPFIKRVVGLPGETIQIHPPHLIVDGKAVTEPTILQRFEYQNAGDLSDPEQRVTLGPDEYFTLGDNTAAGSSLDGRFYGALSRDAILGKVTTIYWPLERLGPVE